MTPEELSIESARAGISRRKVLKRIGVGAAVAWTAPVLTSIRTPAFAQYGCDCPPFNCADAARCENFICFCSRHHGDGGPCVCWSSGFCNDQGQGAICATDEDCAQFGPNLLCADMDSNCGCDGNVACLMTDGCIGESQHRAPLQGLQKLRA